MLTATSRSTYGDARVLTAVFLARRFRALLVWRERLLFDSRYAVPAAKAADVATIYLSLEGHLTTSTGVTTREPVAFALGEDEFERRQDGAAWFRSWGDPAVVLNLRFERADVRVPVGLAHGPLPLGAAAWDAAARIAEATAGSGDVATPMQALLAALVADGVVAPAMAEQPAESPIVRRLWRAVTPSYQRLATSGQVADLASARQVSVRQISREVTALVTALPVFGGFRDSLLLLRLRLAALLISQGTATLTEVAAWVGYASVDAMAGAFKDAGLPAPSVVRDAVRYPQ